MADEMKTLRFARALLITNLKASVMRRGAFAMQVVFMFLNNFTFFVFWWALMRRAPVIRGWRLEDVQVLFGVVAAGYGVAVTVCGGVRYLGRLIDEGELDPLLVQPKPVLLHALGMRSQASGLGDILSGLILIAWSGNLTVAKAPVIALAISTGAVICVACGVVFFSLPFWLGTADTLARQLWELLITFSLYPEPLFGGLLRGVLFTLLPAGFVGYVPASIIRDPSVGRILLLVCAAGLYLAVAVGVFNRGLRRYSSGSRFSVLG